MFAGVLAKAKYRLVMGIFSQGDFIAATSRTSYTQNRTYRDEYLYAHVSASTCTYVGVQ